MSRGLESAMPKSVLLHIGTGKTGSTSIQRWFSDAQERGRFAQICYPLWDSDRNHRRIVALYKPYEDLPPGMRQSYGPNGRAYGRMLYRYREFLFKRLLEANKAVISEEWLYHLSSPQLVTKLREDLELLGFREFHVVLYVRDPADFFLSQMQERLKGGHKSPFIIDPTRFKYEFLKGAENWESVFPGRLIVRKFSNDASFDVIKDFSMVLQQCLGVELPWAPLEENTSLSAEGMKILQDYQEAFWPDSCFKTPDVSRLVQFLGNSKQCTRQTKPTLRREFADIIRANHEDEAKVLYRRYGVDLCVGPTTSANVPSPRGDSYRVDEIVDSVDAKVVNRLLLCLANEEMVRSHRLLSFARNAYAKIPSLLRPNLLKNWLRRRLMGYPEGT